MLACVIAISTLYSLPVAGSVCITTSGPKVYAYSSLVADLNNDGIDDKYVIFDEHSTINLSLDGIAHNNTYEIFESWALDDGRIKGNYGIPTEIIGVDVDNDGYVDVVAAFGSKVVVRINDGNGVFGGSQQFLALSDLYGDDESPIPAAKTEYNSHIVAHDINKDGYSDLAVVHADGISVYINDSSGHYNHVVNYDISDLIGRTIDSVYMADLDQDTYPEMVISAR
jgi:hypothetical protein